MSISRKTACENNYDEIPEFNEYLDEMYENEIGKIIIEGVEFKASIILFKMDFALYEQALEDFFQTKRDEFVGDAENLLPSAIAYNLYKFKRGSEHHNQKLHFMRGTWESIITILHACAIAEIIDSGDDLKSISNLTLGKLFSDKLSARMDTLEALYNHSMLYNKQYAVSNICNPDLMSTLRNLNSVRNEFSHENAKSEKQANELIEKYTEDFYDIIESVSLFKEIKIIRYKNMEAGKIVFSDLTGINFSPCIERVQLEPAEINKKASSLSSDCLFALYNGKLWGLSPFVHFIETASGHSLNTCLFKQTCGNGSNRKIKFSVIGESEEIELQRSIFQQKIDDLRKLFGLQPEA